MNLTKRVWILLCVILTFWGNTALAWTGDGTLLVRDSLPVGWVLELDYLASPGEILAFSNQLGVEIELLRNYVFRTSEGYFQVNFVVTETKEQAEALHQLFLSFHTEDQVSVVGRRVLEIVTENPVLTEIAQASLRFVSEETEDYEQTALKHYIEDNSWPITNLKDVTFPFRAELSQHRVFLVGESHGVAINQELESALLEFFVLEGGVRNYLLELSPSIVGYLREYVETGNEEVLYRAFDGVKGTYFWTKDNLEHWKRVHLLWQSLPEEQKFSLVALDIEHQPLLSLRYLQHLLDIVDPEKTLAQTELGQIEAVLRGELSVSNEEVADFFTTLEKTLGQDAVRAVLGSHLFEFELILANLRNALELSGIQDQTLWNKARDHAMYENFLWQCDLASTEKYFGQWGLGHVYQSEQRGVNWVASLLNQEEAYSEKVLSIVLIYQDSHSLRNFSYEVVPLDTYSTRSNVFREIGGDDPLLIKLDSPGSPFGEQLIWKTRDPKPWEGVTTDYYQYILFVPNAEPSSPLVD